MGSLGFLPYLFLNINPPSHYCRGQFPMEADPEVGRCRRNCARGSVLGVVGAGLLGATLPASPACWDVGTSLLIIRHLSIYHLQRPDSTCP